MKIIFKLLAILLVVTYPLIVFFGLSVFEPGIIAIFLIVIILLRLISFQSASGVSNFKSVIVVSLAGGLIAVFTLISNSIYGLKLYPVLINFSMLVLFAYSLTAEQTIIEKIARIKEPDLPIEGVIYTRKITWIWCCFFICNGLFSLYTALYTSIEFWTIYNGLVSYIIMGALLGGELLYRSLVLQK